jgi:hypothetical protein
MAGQEDFYAVLGGSHDAAQGASRRAYHDLAQKCHPDLNPDDPEADRKFVQIQNAYEWLCEPQRRIGKGAYHTVLSAMATIRCQARSFRRDSVMASSGFAPVLALATVFWLVLVCACGIPLLTANAAGDSLDADADGPSLTWLVAGLLTIVTALYAMFILLVVNYWGDA